MINQIQYRFYIFDFAIFLASTRKCLDRKDLEKENDILTVIFCNNDPYMMVKNLRYRK